MTRRSAKQPQEGMNLVEALVLHGARLLRVGDAVGSLQVYQAARVLVDSATPHEAHRNVYRALAAAHAMRGEALRVLEMAQAAWALGARDADLYQHWAQAAAAPQDLPQPPRPGLKADPAERAVWANIDAIRLRGAGDKARAWRAYEGQNALRRIACEITRDNEEDARNVFETMVASYLDVFSESTLAERGLAASDRYSTTFVLGMPRSGSTLVEQILAAHPHVAAAGEDNGTFDIFVTQVLGKPDLSRAEFVREGKAWFDQSVLVRARENLTEDTKVVIDKTLTAWGGWGVFDLLYKPGVIVMSRDPRDVLLSIWRHDFREGALWWSNDWDDLLWMLGMFYKTTLAWAQRMAALGTPWALVDYESFVTCHKGDRHARIDKLCEQVGVEAHPVCYTPEDVQRTVRTASAYQVQAPISSVHTGKHRGWLDVMPDDLRVKLDKARADYEVWQADMAKVCTVI